MNKYFAVKKMLKIIFYFRSKHVGKEEEFEGVN